MDETYTFKRGVLDAAPTMLGYLSIGLRLGFWASVRICQFGSLLACQFLFMLVAHNF